MSLTRATLILCLCVLVPGFTSLSLCSQEEKLKPLENLLENRHFAAAIEWCERRRPELRYRGYRMVADYFLFWEFPDKAAEYYQKAGYPRGMNRLGTHYLRLNNRDQARFWFDRSAPDRERMRFYMEEGRRREASKDLEGARKDYETAREDLIARIISLEYDTNTEDTAARGKIREALERLPGKPEALEESKRLRAILHKAGEYCRQLYQRVYYYYCIEDIEEHIDRRWELQNQYGHRRGLDGAKVPSRKIKRSYRFDYQLVREDDTSRHVESRTMLKENGIPRRVANASNPAVFRVSQPVFAPIEFLTPRWQSMYWFRILEETRWHKRPVVIIQAVPYDPGNRRTISGRIWIDRKDGSVLRIQMVPKSIRNHHQVRLEAVRRGLTPALTFDIQFLKSSAGFRFPTRCILEERYTSPHSPPFVRVHSEYHYHKYRFFQVKSRVSAPMISEPLL